MYLPQPPPPQHSRRRVGLWVFLGVQILFLVWIIAGAHSGTGTPADCGTLDAETCNSAQNVGTAIGVGLIIGLWAFVDIIFGITLMIIHMNRRKP